jgi:hypothetical protein
VLRFRAARKASRSRPIAAMPHELLNPLRLTFTPRSTRLGFIARGLYVFASVGGVVAFMLLVLLVRERSLPYWADPARMQAGEINHHDGGRDFYFEDPNGHFLEAITRPYGSGGYNP